MTKSRAMTAAKRNARKVSDQNDEYYARIWVIIDEDNPTQYTTASDFDLDTFYNGISESLLVWNALQE